MLRTKDLFERTCKDCGKVFRTDKKNGQFCPSCKKKRRQKSQKEYRSGLKSTKPKPERKYVRETDALFAFVRKVDRYNAEHGTRHSYGQFENAVHNGKITQNSIVR